MRYEITVNEIIVTREAGDPRLRATGSGWSSPMPDTSRLMYWLQKAMRADGHDMIKTTTDRDGGHLTANAPLLRSRKPTKDGLNAYVWHGNYAIETVAECWNRDGVVSLTLVRDIFA